MHFNVNLLRVFVLLSPTSPAATVTAQAGLFSKASRSGTLKGSQTTLSPGHTFKIAANLTCAVQLGNTPTFLDYYIIGTTSEVPSC
ncbi:hypothetical protein B0H11DRAFT_2219523 [Mycena galericulata]|nr:hypothetical protein B0H11DRAFT_2219523 [Mycena galericulata]